ncbi:hypothetical protein [Paracoccus mutanolyticus]|uniref:hypothetical protein n=1 Tax=Paracoccus mutanolyticus TaxID=1499308 RepID=UPI0037CBFB69
MTGRVIDGAEMILRDALFESWQADAEGIYPGNDPRGRADPNVTGWPRAYRRAVREAGGDVPRESPSTATTK